MRIVYHEGDHSVKSIKAIYDALVSKGVVGATILLNGELIIEANGMSKTQSDQAVSDAAQTGLIQAKIDKLKEITDKSDDLVAVGVESWDSGKFVRLSEGETDKRITAHHWYSENPSELSASTPYMALSLNGEVITTTLLTDIDTLAKDMKHRLDYIYLSLSQNADSSKSELILRSEIQAATSIAQLDAITDTRV